MSIKKVGDQGIEMERRLAERPCGGKGSDGGALVDRAIGIAKGRLLRQRGGVLDEAQQVLKVVNVLSRFLEEGPRAGRARRGDSRPGGRVRPGQGRRYAGQGRTRHGMRCGRRDGGGVR